jgi:hypothetical protein
MGGWVSHFAFADVVVQEGKFPIAVCSRNITTITIFTCIIAPLVL